MNAIARLYRAGERQPRGQARLSVRGAAGHARRTARASFPTRWRAARWPCSAARKRAPTPNALGVHFIADENPRARLAAFRRRLLRRPARDRRRRHRHQRQDLGRGVPAPDLDARTGRQRRQHGHHRRGDAGGRDHAGSHHARSDRAASPAGAAESRRRRPSGAGSLQPRPRSVPSRRRAISRLRLHQHHAAIIWIITRIFRIISPPSCACSPSWWPRTASRWSMPMPSTPTEFVAAAAGARPGRAHRRRAGRDDQASGRAPPQATARR